MRLTTLLFGLALAESSYFSLDDLQEGDSIKGDQICNDRICVPLHFAPTEEFQPIYPGQRIPKGLHIRIDYATGIKEAKLMDENEKDENTAVNITPDVVEDSKDAIIHPPESRNTSGLTWEERDTLEHMFEKLNTTAVDAQLPLLEQLSEAAHQVDVGTGLASNLDQILFLLRLLEHPDSVIRSQTAILLGSIYSNNQEAISRISTVPNFMSTIFNAFKTEESDNVKYRLMYLISAVTRSSKDAYRMFSELKPFAALLAPLKSQVVSDTNRKLQSRIINYLIDVKDNLRPIDFDSDEWCQAASKQAELLDLLNSIGACQREGSEL
ncbi:hypothetical protein HDV04_000138 [Boothiomyces sp. JEL0838]|nr:hypothetical protein HDV04_000138 [Boothiomyces sp. JEL0838]